MSRSSRRGHAPIPRCTVPCTISEAIRSVKEERSCCRALRVRYPPHCTLRQQVTIASREIVPSLQEFHNILVRATNWVGDAVMSLPALRALRARFPRARITILAKPWVADLYRRESFADEVIVYPVPGGFRALRDKWRVIHDLRRRQFDAAILLQNAFEAASVAWFARIPTRIGYNRDGRGLLLTHAIDPPAKAEIPRHERFYYLELLRRAGIVEE